MISVHLGGVSRDDYEGGRRYDNRGGRGGERHRLVVNHFVNSSLASGHFCHLLLTIGNSLDPDQDRQNVGPDLDPNCLTL